MKRIIYLAFDHLHRDFGALKQANSKDDVIALVESLRSLAMFQFKRYCFRDNWQSFLK